MSRIIPKDDLKFQLSATERFVDSISPGEEVTVECEINVNAGMITSLDSVLTADDFKFPYLNPVTGPIEVKGAKAGQMLCVTIKAMELDDLGVTCLFPHNGLFQDWIWARQPEYTATKPMRVANGVVHWDERHTIPIAPMVGVIGVAPQFGAFWSIDNGEHGGNIDVQEIAPGTTVYFPIHADGAHLFLGDCHARQGDGEVCGGGAIDIGARVTLSVEVRDRPARMEWPRFETETHIGTIGCARPLEEAMRVAYREMVYWLADEYGFSETEAYMLMGTIAEGRGTQITNPKTTYVCKMRKDLIA